MKFNCGMTYAEYEERLQRWHLWFAWHPVRVAKGDCRWLEKVERKGTPPKNWMDDWSWEHRAIK